MNSAESSLIIFSPASSLASECNAQKLITGGCVFSSVFAFDAEVGTGEQHSLLC